MMMKLHQPLATRGFQTMTTLEVMQSLLCLPCEHDLSAVQSDTMHAFVQGVIEEMRDGNVVRSVRFDSELPNVVCEIPFFMGVSQPRTFQARKTSDVTILALSKFDYEEVMCIYPEQNDIIVSNVLAFFQLDKDGNDVSMVRQTDAEPSNLAEDSKEKLR